MTLKLRALALAAIIVLSCLALTIAASSTDTSSTASAKVTVKTSQNALIGLYSDSACSQKITSISWGALPQGSSMNQTIYIKNLSATKLALRMSTTNWNPATANGPISLTWNCQGSTLRAYQTIPATITVAVASNATGITNFTMDITITGSSTR